MEAPQTLCAVESTAGPPLLCESSVSGGHCPAVSAERKGVSPAWLASARWLCVSHAVLLRARGPRTFLLSLGCSRGARLPSRFPGGPGFLSAGFVALGVCVIGALVCFQVTPTIDTYVSTETYVSLYFYFEKTTGHYYILGTFTVRTTGNFSLTSGTNIRNKHQEHIRLWFVEEVVDIAEKILLCS